MDRTKKFLSNWKRVLNASQHNDDSKYWACLAVVKAALLFCPYLRGQKFTIRTHHYALRRMLNLADQTGILAYWRLRVSEVEFDVLHRAGINKQLTDALSGLGTGEPFTDE